MIVKQSEATRTTETFKLLKDAMRSTLGTKLAFPPINHQTPIYLYLHLRNLIFLTFLKILQMGFLS